MKKIALALAMIAMTGSVYAANSLNAGTMGLSVEVAQQAAIPPAPLIAGKYFVAKDLAILAGFGFNTGGPSGATGTSLALRAGVRKYLKNDDFSPFVGGVFDYGSQSAGGNTATAMSIAAEAGAEYFLGKQFSVEGRAMFGYISVDPGTPGSAKSSYFGTSTAGLAVNFYF